MSIRVLTILEVSQKQAYIFASNKLRNNIVNSANIAWILSPNYFEQKIADKNIFSETENLVYAGGGHTVLTFATKEQAIDFTQKITMQIHKEYPQIELFVKTMEYDETKTPGENLKELTAQLEKKKSIRKSAFHQGSFGIEKIDTNTLVPEVVKTDEVAEGSMPAEEERTDKQLSAEDAGYKRVFHFSELGGSKNESNFIAVVHIDGNAMGKRVEHLYQQNQDADWDTYRSKLKNFSESIDKDFKAAYKDMVNRVVKSLQENRLEQLDVQEQNFPVRRIITAGDDICFVAEGRIGIECAVAFIEALNQKKNVEDKEGYAACAGVAIVHQKYPFYRAYELAELLCSNAKKFGAALSADGSGKEVSAIDWHIEFGEMGDTLEEIRKTYATLDGKQLELRPYIVNAPEEILEKEPIRQYAKFRKLEKNILNNEIAYARGKVKQLRGMLKQGEKEANHFMKFNQIEDLVLESYQGIFVDIDYTHTFDGDGLERKIFVKTYDQVERSILFDAIELLDTFVPLD